VWTTADLEYKVFFPERRHLKRLDQLLLALTVDEVTGYVSNSRTIAEELPALVKAVNQTFASAGSSAGRSATTQAPAIDDVRESVAPDHLVCLVCGRGKTPTRDLGSEHGLTPEAYERYGLSRSSFQAASGSFGFPNSFVMVAAPEPASIALLGTGFIGLLGLRLRRSRWH
jgi:predicted transcriptional regulator